MDGIEENFVANKPNFPAKKERTLWEKLVVWMGLIVGLGMAAGVFHVAVFFWTWFGISGKSKFEPELLIRGTIILASGAVIIFLYVQIDYAIKKQIARKKLTEKDE